MEHRSRPISRSEKFPERLARVVTDWAGSSQAFAIAVGVLLIWAMTGPFFHYSDSWQLVINTGTTIVTFLMVFLIQSTQNRDTEAIQVKLDELIRAFGHARNELLDLEELEEADLDRLKTTFLELAQEARRKRADAAGGRG